MEQRHTAQLKTASRLRGRFLRVPIPRRCWLLLFLPLALLCSLFAQRYTVAGERVFALGLYRWVSEGLGRVTGLLPFSLLEFGLIAIVLLCAALIVRLIVQLIHSPGRRRRLLLYAALNLACVLSAGYFVFTVLCGVNYYRHPFSYYSGLEIRPSTVEELDALCGALALRANELRSGLTEDGQGVMRVFADGYDPVADRARAAMERLGEQYPVLDGYYPRPKAIVFSTFMSRTNLTGVYCPFTMEANVNVASPEYGIPSTMCHELSHLRGFMREDEANFIAYLACAGSDDPAFAYSGVMLALIHAGNQLYRQDVDRYRALRSTYSEGVRRDLEANTAYWKQFEKTVISKVSTSVNDGYLKANRQTDGVQSYGRMVDLLLAWWRAGGGQL